MAKKFKRKNPIYTSNQEQFQNYSKTLQNRVRNQAMELEDDIRKHKAGRNKI
ncbi:MAG: hypothetical protein PHX80_05530 [Candidatus Nanoarchaeia archaeon]|nr:hypothetical protein [Candidatus Nanoarchaeia archaeon]